MKRTLPVIIAGFALASLSGCGLRGDLERPDPLFERAGAEDAGSATEVPGASVDSRIDGRSIRPAEDELLGGPAETEETE